MPSGRRRSEHRLRRRHPRAVAVAAAGVVGLIAAGGFGTPSLRPLGVGLLVLGVGAIALVELTARGLRVTRRLDRDTLRAGERAVMTLQIQGWPVRNRVLSLLDWEARPGIPAGIAAEARRPAVVRGVLRQEIVLPALARGEHHLAAPGIAIGDPFGLARLRRASRASATLVVLPYIVPIAVPFWESGAARRAGQRAGLLRGRSELGGIRDYEPGDPLALIHWAQTARRGRLQTKELHGESGRGASLLVLLDACALAGGTAEEAELFEVAVSAAASLVATCGARGDAVGLDHTAARPASLPLGTPAAVIERALATVVADGDQPVSLGARAVLGRASAPRTLVVVTAATDRGLARAAGQARGAGVNVAAVLVGPARAIAPDLRRNGAWVAEVGSMEGLRAALDGGGTHARSA